MTRSKRSEAQTILRHWRQAVPNDRLAHLIRDAGRALTRALSIRLAEHRVSFGHWSFLRILWEEDGLTQRELSEQAGVMEPTTFSALKSMERLGLVRRRQFGRDRKKVHVFLTRKGRVLKQRLVPLAEEVNAVAIKGVPATHIEVMRGALLAIIENAANDEQVLDKPMPSTRAMARLLRETVLQSRKARSPKL
jgi:MarR family transcriptional regulator, organic hydroperoxide resistance regulator